jgi:hypothetical protein
MYLVKAWPLMGNAQMTIASLCKGMKTAISAMETAIVDSAEEGFANITLLEQFRRSYDRITLLGSYINALKSRTICSPTDLFPNSILCALMYDPSNVILS